jgi:hypothetical protein
MFLIAHFNIKINFTVVVYLLGSCSFQELAFLEISGTFMTNTSTERERKREREREVISAFYIRLLRSLN